MKKILFTVFCALPFSLVAQNAFTINGHVKSLKDGDKIYLVYPKAGERFTDSAMVAGGKFSFKGDVESAIAANLFVNVNPYVNREKATGMDYTSLYLEKGTINVNGDVKIADATITGTPNNNGKQKFVMQSKAVQDELNAIAKEAEKIDRGDTAAMAKLRDRYAATQDKLSSEMIKYAKANPKEVYAAGLLSQLFKNDKYSEEAIAGFEKLDQSVRNNKDVAPFVKMFEVAQNTRIGRSAMDFTQNDANGKPVKLSDFKGKYVLVDFWASWCGPCRMENPNVVAAYHKFKDKGFTVLGVSLDGGKTKTTKEAWLAAVEEDKLAWTQVSDLQGWNNAVAQQYDIHSIPANFLIGPDGKILGRSLRGEELQAKLAELLEKPKAN